MPALLHGAPLRSLLSTVINGCFYLVPLAEIANIWSSRECQYYALEAVGVVFQLFQ
jgi:hypothetical protein